MVDVIEATEFGNTEAIEVHIGAQGKGQFNRLYLCTGTVAFSFDVDDDSVWDHRKVTWVLPDPGPESSPNDTPPPHLRGFQESQIADAISATASLASISADENNIGFAVDSVDADWDPDTGGIRVTCDVALLGDQGHLNRIAYQVNFLAHVRDHVPPPTGGNPTGGHPAGRPFGS